VTKASFVTIKDPEGELETLLQTANTLYENTLKLAKKNNSNERIELVVKPMLEDLKASIENINQKKNQVASLTDPKQRAQELGDPVSFFRMTVNRAETQLPTACGQLVHGENFRKY